MGHAYRDLRKALLALPGAQMSAAEVVSTGLEPTEGLLYLDAVEDLGRGRGERLGSLREAVVALVERGCHVVLVSALPKTAFPETLGSDIISDAKQLFAPGSLAHAPGSGEDCTNAVDHYVLCLRELGDRTVISLAEHLWEAQMSPAQVLASLMKADVEALRGAGFVSSAGGNVDWRLDGTYKDLRQAAALVASQELTVRPALPDTFSELWALERLLRNAVRRALVERMGDGWRQSCLSATLEAQVLERARRDSQPGAVRLRDLRDPLEWLTTGELFDLRETLQLGGLGMEPYLWAKLRNEITPIRNRLAHMRMVSDEDARRSRAWRQVVSRYLTSAQL